MCASAKNVIIPTPHHPNPTPWCCVAPTMCASARNMMLRSTDHVCKCKERDHPHPTPPQPHPTPNFLRSINHVGKFKERDYPPAPPMSTPGEPPVPRVICSWSYIYFFPLPINGRNHSLNHWGCSFKYEVPLFSAQSISYLDIGCCYMLVSGSTNTQFNIMYHPIKSICIYIYISHPLLGYTKYWVSS